jgi:zinc/manganese transport system permease protein
VQRGIIFVDLALAQVAALGVCVAILTGAHPGDWQPYLLLARLHPAGGGAVLADPLPASARSARVHHRDHLRRRRGGRDRRAQPHGRGDEALKKPPGGQRAPAWAGKRGPAHRGAVRRHRRDPLAARATASSLVTFHEHEARRQGDGTPRLGFPSSTARSGFVVTSFVQIAGVYLVFSYLIVPAVCGASGPRRSGRASSVGWIVALLAGLSGLLLSVQFESLDFRTGPTIVLRLRQCCWSRVALLSALRRPRSVTEAPV